MNTPNEKNKGGRPKKPVKRSYRLRVACTALELQIIETKAKQVQLTISEFLREAAFNSHIDTRQKTLPKEVLDFTGQLNHLAANVNSLAYKNNAAQAFNAFERTELRQLAAQLKELAEAIKNSLK
ncbi:plasmid mobilization protein [Niabella beijingensis]|uniref:plasmid mobilization protein n=1 Tax=Niabella beijingensis TaxID=2872700 RepID=UPI001CBF45CB|nr:mobilization protein [Niabella beijingensis]MBZ4190575.1 mobilization protein [Niabella beijingensis]